jgi:hypothetical protein
MTDRFTLGWNKERHRSKRLGTLWDKRDDPDGDVSINILFDDYSDVSKLDVLGDWIGLLEREYNIVYKNLYGAEEPNEVSKLLSHHYKK